MKSRWLSVFAGLLLLAPGGAWAADRGRSAGHRPARAAQVPDVAPIVVTDPGTGAVVKIWSRSDGFTAKLAWARLTQGGWGPAHDLTFGLGIDRDPAVGLTSAGSWLFWRNERGQVFYAPVELASGRLLGLASPLPTVGGVRPGSRFGIEGGTDVPVIMGPCPDNPDLACPILKNPGTPTNPGGPISPPVMEGGTDVPIVPGGSGTGLVVTSGTTCDRQIVTIAEPAGDSLVVIEVDGAGRVASRTMVTLEQGATQEQAGQFFLLQACEP